MVNFSPSVLFANGEKGVWFDPSDIKLTWRRNLLTYSEQFDNAAWVNGNATVTANAAVAPDGTMTADKLVESVGVTRGRVTQSIPTAVGNTISVYAKAAEWNRVCVGITNGAGLWGVAVFNLVNGTVDGVTSYVEAVDTTTITSVGNGWYRCSVRVAAGTSSPVIMPFNQSGDPVKPAPVLTGDGTSGIYIWGAQVEVGTSSTSYQKITDGVTDYYNYQSIPVLYQDYQGTLPVSAVEQPVGLVLDKSKGLALGPELVTNGTFDTATGWGLGTGWSISGGVATQAGGTGGYLTYTVSGATTGKVYMISIDVTGNNIIFANGNMTSNNITITPGIGKKCIVTAINQSIAIYANTNVSIDNFSVREIVGSTYHATQSSSSSRPTLSARYNFATHSEIIGTDSNPWSAYNFNIENNSLALPAGSAQPAYLCKLTATSTPAATVYQMNAISDKMVITFWAHRGTRSVCNFLIRNGTTSVSVLTGQLDANGVSGTGFVGTHIGNGIYKIQVTVSSGFTAGQILHVYYGATGAVTAGEYWYVGGMDIRYQGYASTIPQYQRVNTSTDYDTIGFPSYLRFDGVDDFLTTPSIPLNSDGVTVATAIRKISNKGVGTVFETSTIVDTTNGTVGLRATWEGSADLYPMMRGSNNVGAAVNGYPSPYSLIAVIRDTISTDVFNFRINGTQATNLTNDQGTATFGNYPLFIGRRGQNDLPYNGMIYGFLLCSSMLDVTKTAKLEKYLNKKHLIY